MSSQSVSIADLLGRPCQDKRPIAEAQVATLIEAYRRYDEPCPFKGGDIVTPREGFGYADAGLPHIVLEVAEVPQRNFEIPDRMSIYGNEYGSRLDVRVANFTKSGDVVTFWQESWRLQPWNGEVRP